MRVSGRRGEVRLRLNAVEVQLLTSMLDDLDELVDAMAPEDAATKRLFPDAHRHDESTAAQFRALTEESLRDVRRVRYGVVRAALPTAASNISIAVADQTAWLTTINDLRLALGTNFAVTEEERDFDPDADDAQLWLRYHWLTALQDGLVRAAGR